MKIGAHVSSAGGISKAVERGAEIGAEAIQLFGSSPQGWAFNPIPGQAIEAFRQGMAEANVGPVFLHAIYLINLGTQKEEILEKGVQSLISYMNLASAIGASGVIFHPGSHGGAGYDAIFPQAVSAIQRVLENSPPGPWLLLENMAGMGRHIGAKFDDLGRILRAVDSPRLKVCLDTQHAFAAGRDHLLEHLPFRAVTFRDHLRDDKVGFSPIVYSNEILCDRIALDSAEIEVVRFDFDNGCIRR